MYSTLTTNFWVTGSTLASVTMTPGVEGKLTMDVKSVDPPFSTISGSGGDRSYVSVKELLPGSLSPVSRATLKVPLKLQMLALVVVPFMHT